MIVLVTAVGCSTPPAPVRELYAEARPDQSDEVRLVPFPLDAEPREAYVAVRPLGGGGVAALGSLYAALGEPGARQLVFPSVGGTLRRASATYLGHAAFAYRLQLVHHLRLLVVNRLGHDLHLPIDSIVCESASGPELLAVVNHRVERVQNTWRIPPGDGQLLHVFFVSDGVDPSLQVAWELRAPPGPGGEPAETGPWLFNVELQRHFLLRDAPLSQLERVVVLGEELPPAREPPEPWAEPLLTPVPGPPGEAGGGEGAGG